MVLNIAGPEYDFGSVVFAVLQECEHRRRGLDFDQLEFGFETIAKEKLAHIRKAFDEFGGSPSYWESLQREVMKTALPQYTAEAKRMHLLEARGFDVWRNGDVAARLTFALAGLIVGSAVIRAPFIPIFEVTFAFASTATGFAFPDLQRYMHERRHARVLNRIIEESVAYQRNAKLHYMTRQEIHDSFALSEPAPIDPTRGDAERE
jgi:hypothetical protein